MTIQDLYAFCDNLGPCSDFAVYRGSKVVFTGGFREMKPAIYEATVTGFSIVGGTNADIFII